MTLSENLNWYVIRTNSRAERKVLERITLLGFNAYFPETVIVKQWSDRKKKVKSALIPSTVFVSCDASQLLLVSDVQGVSSILKYLGKPAVVKQNEIDLLKQYCENGFQTSDESFVLGDAVDVNQGPLAGLTGQVVKGKGKHKIKIRIDSLGMNCIVDIPKSFVEKINAVA